MEDRDNTGLYLEMTDSPAAEYSARRVPELLASPGVTRATWWANVRRDRDDLPRVLPEFDLLGAYEVEPDFTAPEPPDGVRGHYFRRTPRPGQGRLTGRPTVGLSLVLISPRQPARAQDLRDWGDFVHIRHIAEVAVPGYTMITPYERVGGGDPRFLHLYEMDTDEPEAAFQAMTPLVQARLDGKDAFQAWAWHDALRIMYVNSFRLLGARAR
jgi:hypothetical protein